MRAGQRPRRRSGRAHHPEAEAHVAASDALGVDDEVHVLGRRRVDGGCEGPVGRGVVPRLVVLEGDTEAYERVEQQQQREERVETHQRRRRPHAREG